MEQITFEDKGQDFLKWIVDENGIVVDVKPFQAFTWRGIQVVEARVGYKPVYMRNDELRELNYKIESIKPLSNAEIGRLKKRGVLT